MQSENENAGAVRKARGEKISEVEVIRQEHLSFLSCFLQNGMVGEPLQLCLLEVEYLVAALSQGPDCAYSNSHVRRNLTRESPLTGESPRWPMRPHTARPA
jgi:hypothetical protein